MKLRVCLGAFLTIAFLIASCSLPVSLEGDNDEAAKAIAYEQTHRTGVLPEIVRYPNAEYVNDSLPRGPVPAVLDLAKKLPNPGNQGKQGSCVGWAVAYATKSYHEGVEMGWNVTLPEHIFSPSWVYNQINNGSDSGSRISDALNLLVSSGCDTIKMFPYNQNDYKKKPDAASMARAKKYKAKSWNYVKADVTTLKNVLLSGNVVVFSIAVKPDFDKISATNKVYDDASGKIRGYHALCIIGYDDTLKAFKFINSWGTNWGLTGYGYISYNFTTSGSPVGFSAYQLVDGPNVK